MRYIVYTQEPFTTDQDCQSFQPMCHHSMGTDRKPRRSIAPLSLLAPPVHQRPIDGGAEGVPAGIVAGSET